MVYGSKPREELVPYPARFYESQMKELRDYCEQTGLDMMTVIRRGVDREIKSPEKDPVIAALPEELEREARLTARFAGERFEDLLERGLQWAISGGASNVPATPIIASANCGPWEEALANATRFTLSKEMFDELEAREGDVFIRARGESMDGSGIHDDYLILMRPLLAGREPSNGEVTLVQIKTSDGQYLGTIKHWHPGTPYPALKDGNGKEFAFPKNTKEVRPVAVGRAIVGRI